MVQSTNEGAADIGQGHGGHGGGEDLPKGHGDRAAARELIRKLQLSPSMKSRFDMVDRSLDGLAYRDPGSGELYLSRGAMEKTLAPALTPAQSDALLDQISQALGNRLRDHTSGQPISWDLFTLQSGLAQRPGAEDLFTADLAAATTPEEIYAAVVAQVPEIENVDMPARVSAWIDQIVGSPANASGLDTAGHLMETSIQSLNVSAVNVCIEQKVAAWWWGIALFVAACMIITFPAWWLGLAVSGIAVAGWLLVIIINCLISVG